MRVSDRSEESSSVSEPKRTPNPEAMESPTVDEVVGRSEQFSEAYDTARFVLEAASLIRRMRQRAIRDDGGIGYTQTELAERLPGISQPRISAIERGEGRDGVSYSLLKRVARACNIEWPAPHPLVDVPAGERLLDTGDEGPRIAAARGRRLRRRVPGMDPVTLPRSSGITSSEN